MNTDKVYILQKDLPDLKAGAEFKRHGDITMPTNSEYSHSVPNGKRWYYSIEQVENNPEWFKPEENKSNDSFQWTDSLVKELLYCRFPFPEGIASIQPILDEFKKDHTPKPQADGELLTLKALHEQEEDARKFELRKYLETKPQPQKEEQRIEIRHIEPHDSFRGNAADTYWYQFSSSKPIVGNELNRIRQYIENCLNRPEVPYDWQFRYTQQQVDSMCEDAWKAARQKIGVPRNPTDPPPFNKYDTFQDYKNSKQKQ